VDGAEYKANGDHKPLSDRVVQDFENKGLHKDTQNTHHKEQHCNISVIEPYSLFNVVYEQSLITGGYYTTEKREKRQETKESTAIENRKLPQRSLYIPP
jgi:hypothetical protein